MKGVPLKSYFTNTAMRRQFRGPRGFTIVELLIVVAVIAILAAITIVAYNGITNQAKDSAVQAEVKQGATALAVYQARNGAYPVTCDDAGVKVSADHELDCSIIGDGFCISISRGDVSYRASHESFTPSAGSCTSPASTPDTQTAKLTASDGAVFHSFGVSVALSADTAVFGATGNGNGAAYIFVKNGDNWSQQAKLTASDGEASDSFGSAVSISGDTVVIGAHYDDDLGSNSGSAYVFTRNGGTWTEQAKLLAEDGAAGDYFGRSVSVSGDSVAIGAFGNDSVGSNSGSAYIFTRSNGVWAEQTKLLASDAAASHQFGYSVSLSGDTALVGTSKAGGNGSAYVFTRAGDTWAEQSKLTASDTSNVRSFGNSVSLSGNTVVIGAPGNGNGVAYIFSRMGGEWTQQARLTASDGIADDRFGYSVAVSSDTVVVGAYYNDDLGSNSGSAYIFTRNGSIWSEKAKLLAEDGTTDDYFGYSVGLGGNTAVIGAYRDDVYRGSAYIFQ